MLSRTEFLAMRCGKLGGSDLATLLGHGFGEKPLARLWQQKRTEFLAGKPAPSPSSWRMDVGTALEDTILDYAPVALAGMVRKPATLTIPEYPWFVANLDAYLEDGGQKVPVDAKNASNWKRSEWDAGVPEKYRIQMNAYMRATGADHAWLVVSIGEDEPIAVRVERDEALIARMFEAGAAFMLAVELGEELRDDVPQQQMARTEREGTYEVKDAMLRDLTVRWAKAKRTAAVAEKEADALAVELLALAPSDSRRLVVDGVEILRIDQRENRGTDWSRLNTEHPGLLDRYRTAHTYSTFPVLSRKKV